MKHTFNEYAQAFVKDVLTAIPRCYRMVFNDVVKNGEWVDTSGMRQQFLSDNEMKITGHASALCYTANAAALGVCAGVLVPVIIASKLAPDMIPQMTPILLAGMFAGANAGTPAFMKFYKELRNWQLAGREKNHAVPYTKLEDEAFPEVSKLRHEDRSMNP